MTDHVYLSTACLHGAHEYCGARYNAYTLEPKKPAECKYCEARCICGCHKGREVKPTVGCIVLYRSYGTPGGEYGAENRAAVVTEVQGQNDQGDWIVGLAVLNPTGMFFNREVRQDEAGQAGGTWHWPKREGA